MSRVAVLIRLSCGLVGGLLFGQVVSRTTATELAAAPPTATQTSRPTGGDSSEGDQHPTRPRIAKDVIPIPSYADEQVMLQEYQQDTTPTTALENEIEQASVEMRQLDRLELPERGEVAWRLHERLCNIGDRLLEHERSSAIPCDAEATWNPRPKSLTDNRDLIRSLLAAIAVAPEKSAFMAKASRDRIETEGRSKASQLVVVGNLKRIKENDRAWFFQLEDPFNATQQHMVRVNRSQLTQRIPVGSRVVALGRTVPHDGGTDTPIMATEIYAVRAEKY